MKPIKEIAKKFNFYKEGDMNKFYNALINEGYDIDSITHTKNYNNCGIAATLVVFYTTVLSTNRETIVWG